MLYYALCEIIGIIVAGFVAWQLKMPKPNKATRTDIYIAGVIGMLIGMKLPVWISYGFSSSLIISGKSYMGGLLGAFLGINLYKYFSEKQTFSFGGRFAIPLAIAAGFGKIGCYLNGCCGGNSVIPPQLLESAFEFLMAGLLYLFYKKTNRTDLLFPIYLLSYLIMRFLIEFIRNEPKIFLDLSVYQILSLIFIPVFITLIQKRSSK